jgi:3-methyladenine DNA glycosylase/8-oxoguanine DNA glycosylase
MVLPTFRTQRIIPESMINFFFLQQIQIQTLISFIVKVLTSRPTNRRTEEGGNALTDEFTEEIAPPELTDIKEELTEEEGGSGRRC